MNEEDTAPEIPFYFFLPFPHFLAMQRIQLFSNFTPVKPRFTDKIFLKCGKTVVYYFTLGT